MPTEDSAFVGASAHDHQADSHRDPLSDVVQTEPPPYARLRYGGVRLRPRCCVELHPDV